MLILPIRALSVMYFYRKHSSFSCKYRCFFNKLLTHIWQQNSMLSGTLFASLKKISCQESRNIIYLELFSFKIWIVIMLQDLSLSVQFFFYYTVSIVHLRTKIHRVFFDIVYSLANCKPNEIMALYSVIFLLLFGYL